MNLDQLAIEIRPRRAWEAVDLGLLMARRWWWPMTKVWLLLTLPLFLLLNLIPNAWLWLSYLLLWWLKPLFERPLLHILSQAIFNQAPATRTTLSAFLTLAKRQVFASLSWRRLSPSRSMDLPVIQLEGLRGARRRDRLDILHREDSLPSSWLSIVGYFLEIFISLGLIALLYILIPEEIDFDQTQFFNTQDSLWTILFCCYYLATVALAPFYVACGFSLYLNRRIKLEAWDIDIAFQRIVAKRLPVPTNTVAAILFAMIFIAGLGQHPQAMANLEPRSINAAPEMSAELHAELSTEVLAPYQRASAKTAVEEILAGGEFHQKKTIRYPGFNFGDTLKKDNEDGFWHWFFGLFKAADKMVQVASAMELLLWTAILCLIVFVVIRYRHWLAAYLPQGIQSHAGRATPVTLFGLDLTRESLPTDISEAALALWRGGEQRPALALLYRASLSRLLERGLEIDDAHTEAECLHAAQEFARENTQAKSALAYFAQLTRVWQHLAYGHIAPDAADVEYLCSQWNVIWDPVVSAPRRGAGNE